MLAAVAFWVAVAVVVYGYAGFPLLVTVVGRIRDRRVRQKPITPSVSLIVAAYNEEDGIQQRVENALRTDYPEDALEVIVASDGSTDATEAIVSRFDPERVRLLSLPRQGKAYALNEAVRHSRGEILVFSDANTLYEPDALRALARNFADPEVGGVAGNTGYVMKEEGESAGRGEMLYWRYDTWLKRLETRTGSVVSAHGGMYAIRKGLFRPLRDAAVTDDFAVSTAVVEQGWRLVFEPEARGYEAPVKNSGREFHRRVRLMTRGLRGVMVLRRHLLDPGKYGFYSVSLFSHKVLRRVLPLFLPVLFISSVALSAQGALYMGAALAQGLFYALALGGWALRGARPGRWKLFYVPFFYCMANLASLVALWNVVRGQRIERWSPQRHEPEAEDEAWAGNGDGGVGNPWIPKGTEASLPAEVHEELRRRRIAFCVLRRPGAGGPERREVTGLDVLVDPDDAPGLERVLLDHDFLLLPPVERAFRSHLLGRAASDGRWVQVNVRTELLYGWARCFRTTERAGRVVGRRGRAAGLPGLSAEDELVDLLLHALLDRGRVSGPTAHRLRELMEELRRCPPLAGRAAERVQFELAPAITWEDLLRHVRGGEWEALLRRRRALALRLARPEPLRTLGRLVAGSPVLFSRSPLRGLTRQGRIVALLAPEGGGRSTVARSLARSAPAPARVVYGGYPYPMRHVPRPLHRPASFWWRALRVRWLRASGHLVIMDRYVFDGWMDRNGPSPRRRRWTRRLLEWPFPKPDLVVVLGVPGEEPHRRSGEHASATLEEQREHLPHRRHVPGVVVVDATRPQEEVLEAVTGYLWREDRRVAARQRWTG